MKHTALVAGLLALLGASAVGCKSTPKMAWWKSDKAAESTAVAHSAPQLPSDLAKQSESPSGAAQVAGGSAAPFVPSQTASSQTGKPATVASAAARSYPSTTAPAFGSSATAQTAGSSSLGQQASSANLGSIAMPYNPSLPPAAKAAPAGVASTLAGADRYGSALGNVAGSSTAAIPYGHAAAGAASATNPAANSMNSALASTSSATSYAGRYGAVAGNAASAAQSTIPSIANAGVSGAQAATQQAAAPSPSPSIRYGAAPSFTPTPVTTASASVPAATTGSVASAQPYRPGGTSTYPTTAGSPITTQPPVQVATRPAAGTSSTTPGAPTPAPTVAVPGAATPAVAQPTTTSRYW